MANINGTYKNEKNENLDEFLKANGEFNYTIDQFVKYNFSN